MAALFGPGGNSEEFHASGYRSSADAPDFVRDKGLDAYEYEAGRGIAGAPETLLEIGRRSREYGIAVSIHSPYFISLSSVEPEKRVKSVGYLRETAAAGALLGAGLMVVHTGSAAKISRETAMEYAADTLRMADEMLAETGFPIVLGLETMGKLNQLGTLDEVLTLCKLSPRFAPVIDFGHMNAREQGALRTVDDFKRVFDRIATELSPEHADKLHCHFSRIEYTAMGEKKHLTFADTQFGPDPLLFAQAIRELGVSPTVICESAGTQSEDALFLKNAYLAN